MVRIIVQDVLSPLWPMGQKVKDSVAKGLMTPRCRCLRIMEIIADRLGGQE